MNTIEVENVNNGNYSPGDLFVTRDGKVAMLVCEGDFRYSTVILESGTCWNSPCEHISDAIQNTKYLGSDASITIKFNQK